MRTIVNVVLWVVFITTVSGPRIAAARHVPIWMLQMQEIAERSDLIVVACPVASWRCGEATNAILEESDSDGVHDPRVHSNGVVYPSGVNAFVPTETSFFVVSVLKGECGTNRLVMFHYEWDPKTYASNRICQVNSPTLLWLDYPKESTSATDWTCPRPRHLLFLKRRGGRLYPTTGLENASLSVEVLQSQEIDRGFGPRDLRLVLGLGVSGNVEQASSALTNSTSSVTNTGDRVAPRK
jgi:hypothetical protein